MSRLRLLCVISSPVRAGAEEVALAVVTRLDRARFEPALAAPAPLLAAMRAELAAARVPTFAAGADSWTSVGQVAELARVIRRFRPDVVNPHLFRTTLVAAPLAKWLGVPAVVETYHGREAWRQGPIRGRFVVDRFVSRWVDRVIAVSEAARDFLVTAKSVPPARIVVVPNGRDLSVFTPGAGGDGARKELGLGAEVPVIGVVARLEPQKGHAFLLDAFPRVLREFPDARLLLVGDGSLRGACEAQCRRLGIASSVVFTGFRGDVPRLLDAVDVAVLPSLYEGMPLTAIEAAAMAKPVVATRVDGTPEVVTDGVTGRLVPPRDSAALAASIVALLRDLPAARRMGRAGRAAVLARFDLDAQIAATAAVYREALGR